ncbi:MAG: hypothetical protein IAF94_00545 [Pirellulaceae bacterium]|nr:hypothetical protein [Pirellulaceae bacterium]
MIRPGNHLLHRGEPGGGMVREGFVLVQKRFTTGASPVESAKKWSTSMGLTVHYTLTSDCQTADQARRLLGKLRQKALDLPVESVSEIRRLRGVVPEWGDGIKHDPLWLDCVGMVQRGPWAYNVLPKHALAFTVWLGDGCESASFGLCQFPKTITGNKGKRIRTGFQGWTWHSFCKTQYASNPACGGMENFLRCHLSLTLLLAEAVKLGMQADVHDEGRFWKNRDVKSLAQEVGEWNEMLAGLAGEVKDLLGDNVESAIAKFPNFEHLEARGRARK